MSNIHNFTNRQLCEYASIFPTVASLLDHLLFTNGNGYGVRKGMIMDDNGVRIDEYPEMTHADWNALIASCHAKERKFAEKFARGKPIDEAEISEQCIIYRRHSVSDADFTVQALRNDLVAKAAQRKQALGAHAGEYYLRPYPLSKGYADVFCLDKNTPEWLVQIAFNFCTVWAEYLTNEIDSGHVWIPRSQRPVVELTEEEKNVRSGMSELFATIKTGNDYDGWLDRPEPESDYADLSWTTTHRDLLAAEAQRLAGLLA